ARRSAARPARCRRRVCARRPTSARGSASSRPPRRPGPRSVSTCSQLRRLGGLRPLEAALEPLHPATRVDELLLTRVERVAVRADLDVQLWLRRAGLELVSARAVHGREHVFGMYTALHRRARIAAAIPLTSPPPPAGTTITLASAASSSSSSAIVPCPAITAGSSNPWTSVRPVSATRSPRRSNAVRGSDASRSTVPP